MVQAAITLRELLDYRRQVSDQLVAVRNRLELAGPVLRARLPVTSELPAGEVADLLRVRCARCVHFRNRDWQETKKIWGNAPIGNTRRQALIGFQPNPKARPSAGFFHGQSQARAGQPN